MKLGDSQRLSPREKHGVIEHFFLNLRQTIQQSEQSNNHNPQELVQSLCGFEQVLARHCEAEMSMPFESAIISTNGSTFKHVLRV
jgi:hypothetical protein